MNQFFRATDRGTAGAHQLAISQILQIYGADDENVIHFPSNTTLLWSCEPADVLEFLVHGAAVKFLANELTTTCHFPQFRIPNDHQGPFTGIEYANAGVLEVESYDEDAIMYAGHHKLVVPLNPVKSYEMLTFLYTYGWNPATGKWNEEHTLVQSLPSMADAADMRHRNLTNLLNFAARQGITDISNIDLQTLYPRELAFHYRGLIFDSKIDHPQNVHIKLERMKWVEDLGIDWAEAGLDSYHIKARASHDGLSNFGDCVSDLDFTQTLLRALGLDDQYIAQVELLEEAYVSEYYEDINNFGYSSFSARTEALLGLPVGSTNLREDVHSPYHI